MSTKSAGSGRDRIKDEANAEETHRPHWFSRFFLAVRKRLGGIMLLILATTAAMTTYVLTRSKVYVAYTDILVEQGSVMLADGGLPTSGGRSGIAANGLGSEIKLIGSALIIEKVIDEVDPTFDRPSPFSPMALWRMLMEDDVGGDDAGRASSRRLEAFRAHLDIVGDPSTSVLTVSYRWKDPETAATVANAVAGAYLEHRGHDRRQTERRGEQPAPSVRAGDRGHGDQGVEDVSNDMATSPIQQRYARLSEELTAATLELADIRARMAEATAALESGVPLDGFAWSAKSSLDIGLLERDRELRHQIRTLSNRPDNDGVALIRAETDLAMVREAIDEDVSRIVQTLRLESRAAETRFEELKTQVERAGAELVEMRRIDGRAGEPQPTNATPQTARDGLLGRLDRLDGPNGGSVGPARIIEPAAIPTRPNLDGAFLLIGSTFAGSCLLGIGWALLAELKRQGFNDAQEAESYLGQPVLGMLPNISGVVPLGANLQLSSREKEWALEGYAFIEGVRGIINAILPLGGADSAQAAKIIAITSCFPDEGKTTLALSLVRQAAAGGVGAILIEGDMRKAGLAVKLRTVSPKHGLVDVLRGTIDQAEDAIVCEIESGADMLLAMGPSDDAFALSRSPRLWEIIGAWKSRYDLIIVDCPPVLGVSDAQALCSVADEVLFAVRWQETQRAAVRSAIRELQPPPIAGLVMTQVDLASHLRFATAGKYRYQDEFTSYAMPGPKTAARTDA